MEFVGINGAGAVAVEGLEDNLPFHHELPQGLELIEPHLPGSLRVKLRNHHPERETRGERGERGERGGRDEERRGMKVGDAKKKESRFVAK